MNKGFTLVELSIVLVIIGMLVGGILVGQSLIDSAKINSMVREIQQYDIATATFYSKYKQYPGDTTKFPNPGNGDGIVTQAGASYEFDNYWYHLSSGVGLKKMKGGLFAANEYPLTISDISASSKLHVQNTESQWGGATPGWLVDSNLQGMNNSYVYADAAYGQYGAYKDSLLPKTMLPFDQKIDDGLVNTGKVRADYAETARAPCGVDASGTLALKTNANAKYDLVGANKNTPCSLYVAFGFNGGVAK